MSGPRARLLRRVGGGRPAARGNVPGRRTPLGRAASGSAGPRRSRAERPPGVAARTRQVPPPLLARARTPTPRRRVVRGRAWSRTTMGAPGHCDARRGNRADSNPISWGSAGARTCLYVHRFFSGGMISGPPRTRIQIPSGRIARPLGAAARPGPAGRAALLLCIICTCRTPSLTSTWRS